MQWRLLDLPPLSAAENMALDEVLLEVRGQGHSQDTLRFLQFSPAAVLIGYHQSVQEEIRLSYVKEHGIDINRRITGGGGLLFDESQLGWEIICQKSFFNVNVPDSRLFEKLCGPTIDALHALGVNANFRPRNDIEVNGRKISGTGGTDSDDAFLFQGTLLVDFDVETMLRCLRIPIEKLKAKEIESVKKRVTCLAWELGKAPDLRHIKEQLAEAFSRCFGLEFVVKGLTAEEEDLLAERLPYFSSQEWIDMVRPDFERSELLQSARKSPYGMVRMSLQVNPVKKLLKNIFITGDFLSFPGRALCDLEAQLRGQPLEEEKLCRTIYENFESGKIFVPDMGPEDFCIPLRSALEKLAIARHGIAIEDCNRIFTVNGAFDEILAKKPTALLLPYCAKNRRCVLRRQNACRACGECSVGYAWELGRGYNLKTVCITNFEDLMRELTTLVQAGAPAFIGCCCQPFYVKHQADFERVGLSGILINIENTTCYELNQNDLAYAGKFEGQTSLNLALLEKIVRLNVCVH